MQLIRADRASLSFSLSATDRSSIVDFHVSRTLWIAECLLVYYSARRQVYSQWPRLLVCIVIILCVEYIDIVFPIGKFAGLCDRCRNGDSQSIASVGKHILRYLDVKCILLFVLVKHVRAPSIDQREARQRARSAVFFPPAVRYGNAATRHRTGTTGYSYK